MQPTRRKSEASPRALLHSPPRPPLRASEPTVSVCLLWAWGAECVSTERLQQTFDAAGIDLASLVDPRTRIPTSVSNHLLEMELAEHGDPVAGLRIGMQCAPGAYGMVEQLARSAATLRDSIVCYERFGALIQEAAEVKLIEQGQHAHIVYCAHAPQPRAVVDFVLSYTVALMQRDVEGGVTVESLWLSAPPCEHRDAYQDLMGVPVRFDAPHDAVVIRREDLAKRMSKARAPVHAILESKARRALDRLLAAGTFGPRVRSSVRDHLEDGGARLELTARRLYVSPATLRRRLADEGTCFSDIVDAVREELARREVLSARLEPGQIATRLGFAHPNGFYKAFKRWTGLSPGEYRAQNERL